MSPQPPQDTLTATEPAPFTIDQGHGPVVVLVHGFPLEHRMWQHQIDALSASYRVIAIDLPGFGASPLPAHAVDNDNTMDMDDYARSIAAALDSRKVSKRVHLVGFSMGGYISFAFARLFPDRLASLTLVDTKAAPDTADGAKGRLETARKVLAEGSDVVAEAMSCKLFARITCLERPHLVEETKQLMASQSPQGVAAALGAMARRPDSTPDLASIRIPTLVLVGLEDAITPPFEMKKVADALPQSQYIKIADAGHLTTLEQPGEVNQALLSFLEEHA